jgi:hypothetical protein
MACALHGQTPPSPQMRLLTVVDQFDRIIFTRKMPSVYTPHQNYHRSTTTAKVQDIFKHSKFFDLDANVLYCIVDCLTRQNIEQ